VQPRRPLRQLVLGERCAQKGLTISM
jgi:hypothetical protein